MSPSIIQGSADNKREKGDRGPAFSSSTKRDTLVKTGQGGAEVEALPR